MDRRAWNLVAMLDLVVGMKPSGHSASALLANNKWAYFIPRDAFVAGKGFRVSVVVDGQKGHFPTGTQSEPPWFWGKTYAEAEERAAIENDALGMSSGDVVDLYKKAGVL